jgi:stage V sporulation protein G
MHNIDISEINIVPIKPKEGLLAFASCVLNNQYFIGNIAIYASLDGGNFRLVYPTKLLSNGKQISCFHPINRETGEALRKAISKKYEELIRHIGQKEVAKTDVEHA